MMIEQLSKDIFDHAYVGFPAYNDKVASEKRFSQDSLRALSFAIKKMFQMLDIDKNLSILKVARIIWLDKLDFAKACFCNSCCQDYLYACSFQTDELAREFYKKNYELNSVAEIDEDAFENELTGFYGKTYACSNKHKILLNIGAISPKLGLHLVCHELMHALASPQTVAMLIDKTYGDEAINEFFARLATLIFNSMENENSEISGYTLWEDSFEYPHSKELGLYGTLMANDEKLQSTDWNDPNLAVECCKKLARFYFLNQ